MASLPDDYPVAIVTGGLDPLGREIARALADRGYTVVVTHLPAAGGAVEASLAADGIALAVRADAADELDVERAFDETAAAFGGVDVVVHGGSSVVERVAARRLRAGGASVRPLRP